jgi:general L-amino acid transport system permease protein
MTGRIVLPDVPELELAPEKPPQGLRVWMKNNLFSSWGSTVLTIGGFLLAWVLFKGMAGFVFDYAERRWDALTENAKLLMVQNYPAGTSDRIVDSAGERINQIHRVWISVGVVGVLTALSLVFWRTGGHIAPRRISKALMTIGGVILFTFLGITIIDYVAGVVTGLDFGGWDWQFSGKVHLWTIVAGVAFIGAGLLANRALGDRAKEETIPVLGVIGLLAATVVGSLWIIKLPVRDPANVAGSGVNLKLFEGIAGSTALPWTIILAVTIIAYFVALWMRKVLPEATTRRVLVLAWLLSFPLLVLAVLNDPAFDEVHAPGFDLTEYIVIALVFLVVGGLIIAAASHPRIGEAGAAIAGVIGLAVVASWAVSQLMIVRLLLITLLFFVLGAKTFGGSDAARRRYLTAWVGFIIVLTYILILMKGGNTVETQTNSPFGGFLLTVLIFVSVMLLSFPFGVVLALGRTSTMPIFRLMSVAYIEVIRGVPLITWLFMAVIFLPFAVPPGADLQDVTGVILVYSAFSAAYLAENVRGGLQAIRAGQKEASKALGMSTLQTTIFIILPQALRTVIPALVGQAIATFKDTSLIGIVGLLDFLALAEGVIPGSPGFRGSVRTTLLVA